MAQTANPKIKRALVSVSDKDGIVEFCSSLHNDFGIEIISTGGTLKTLLKMRDQHNRNFTAYPDFLR